MVVRGLLEFFGELGDRGGDALAAFLRLHQQAHRGQNILRRQRSRAGGRHVIRAPAWSARLQRQFHSAWRRLPRRGRANGSSDFCCPSSARPLRALIQISPRLFFCSQYRNSFSSWKSGLAAGSSSSVRPFSASCCEQAGVVELQRLRQVLEAARVAVAMAVAAHHAADLVEEGLRRAAAGSPCGSRGWRSSRG